MRCCGPCDGRRLPYWRAGGQPLGRRLQQPSDRSLSRSRPLPHRNSSARRPLRHEQLVLVAREVPDGACCRDQVSVAAHPDSPVAASTATSARTLSPAANTVAATTAAAAAAAAAAKGVGATNDPRRADLLFRSQHWHDTLAAAAGIATKLCLQPAATTSGSAISQPSATRCKHGVPAEPALQPAPATVAATTGTSWAGAGARTLPSWLRPRQSGRHSVDNWHSFRGHGSPWGLFGATILRTVRLK